MTCEEVDAPAELEKLLARTPFKTLGQWRDSMGYSSDLCCDGCYDYEKPYGGNLWGTALTMMWLADIDWRTVK